MRPRNHHPTLTHPTICQPIPSPSFLFPFLSAFLLHARPLSPSSSCHLSALSSYPSSCLWQPYKPWSSAGASSFTRAMYPDVSEGRNFASVCVLLFSFSLSLPPVSCSPLVPSTLCSLPLSIFRSCKVRANMCARVADACGAYVCTMVHVRHSGAHVRRKIRSAGMLGGYVSERYPSMKVSRSIEGNGYLLSVYKCEFVWITRRDGSCEIRWISLVFSLLCLPTGKDTMRSKEIVLGQRFC